MPLQATSGAASYDAFGGGVPVEPTFIEEVFSTYLYTGTGAALTITNNIDLSTKGGLVWGKNRSTDATFGQNYLSDTSRGITRYLVSNSTDQQFTPGNVLTSANTTGFSIGDSARLNNSGVTYASWTFREQAKFFDVVTWTGTGSAQTISHNLGSTPGCIIVKRTSGTQGWIVYHRSLTSDQYFLQLNLTDAQDNSGQSWAVTDTTFNANSNVGINASGQTFVAYLFAHNAGGFGLTGTDNVISCGLCTAGTFENLGYEPQWVMLKNPNSSGSGWFMFDNMRGGGLANYVNQNALQANSSGAESSNGQFSVSATGFTFESSCIYIAIRRGPMKVPTSGTSVFSPVAYSGTGATRTITAGFPVDLAIPKSRGATGNGAEWYSRLIGPNQTMLSSGTFAEFAIANELTSFASNTGVVLGSSSTSGGTNASGSTYVDWNFQRAPSFFDEVCYTGNGTYGGRNHNLTVTPELIITKKRSATSAWTTIFSALGSGYMYLNTTAASGGNWGTLGTSTVFYPSDDDSGATYVAYLFATCAGVSKVGSYTGNGSSQTINCGFTAGARFVLIKKSSGTGDWMVADSARGIVSGNDPYLELNNTNAEVTGEDWLDTDSTGFVVNEVSGSNANTNGATYIFLAIA